MNASLSKTQRPPAEVLYAEELTALAAADQAPRPPGWLLSPQAVSRFVLGDRVRPAKVVMEAGLLERAMTTLATSRALLLVGEPGTAKSLLSELLAAAIGGSSTLTLQGGASLTEDQIKYGWNYALLVSEGPSRRALAPGPLMVGMSEGRLVRFEEITRCPPEVQDCLLSPLSERALAIPELGEQATVYAREGFNLIATANTRDRGVNEMSAALKRRFNFETVPAIRRADDEAALVKREATRLLTRSGVPNAPPDDVIGLLVSCFRELREGVDGAGVAFERCSAPMSSAEAVAVAHMAGVRAHYMRGAVIGVADVIDALAGVAAKDDAQDRARLRRYIERRAARPGEPHGAALRAARSLLDD